MVQSVNADFLKMNRQEMLTILDLPGRTSVNPAYTDLMNLNAKIVQYFMNVKVDAGSGLSSLKEYLRLIL